MPIKPKKPCRHPGCPMLTAAVYCEFHAKLHTNDRASSHDRGYSSQWQKIRKQFLINHPLCSHCERKGKLKQATVVDPIKPHRGDKVLFWNENNWQPLCKKCHDMKTQANDRHPTYCY